MEDECGSWVSGRNWCLSFFVFSGKTAWAVFFFIFIVIIFKKRARETFCSWFEPAFFLDSILVVVCRVPNTLDILLISSLVLSPVD